MCAPDNFKVILWNIDYSSLNWVACKLVTWILFLLRSDLIGVHTRDEKWERGADKIAKHSFEHGYKYQSDRSTFIRISGQRERKAFNVK